MYFIPVMAAFSTSSLQSSVSHDPSEINQDTNFYQILLFNIFVETMMHFF